jgi:alkylation response protein AidB-like acyl-CoA dehydrogenase
MSATLVLDDAQRLLDSAAADLVARRSPLARVRDRRAAGDETGFDRRLWKELGDLGWAGITIPEELGGAGGHLADLAVILEQLGRTIAATPYLSSIVLGAGLIAALGSDGQKAAFLPAICSGETLVAVGIQDGNHHSLDCSVTSAARTGDDWSLGGAKRLVIDGQVADRLIVLARTPVGLGAFVVRPATAGVTVGARRLLDHRPIADVRLDDVVVGEGDVLGEPGGIQAAVGRVVDAATAALAAEMLGSACAAFDLTVAYLKDRHQFGVPIGSFQGLQHRASVWHCDLELARSVVQDAVRAVDDDRDDRPAAVSAAKAIMSELALRSGAEAIQMHGGIGMTDEADPGLYAKRARVTSTLLGDASYHRRRFATLKGYLSTT